MSMCSKKMRKMRRHVMHSTRGKKTRGLYSKKCGLCHDMRRHKVPLVP